MYDFCVGGLLVLTCMSQTLVPSIATRSKPSNVSSKMCSQSCFQHLVHSPEKRSLDLRNLPPSSTSSTIMPLSFKKSMALTMVLRPFALALISMRYPHHHRNDDEGYNDCNFHFILKVYYLLKSSDSSSENTRSE